MDQVRAGETGSQEGIGDGQRRQDKRTVRAEGIGAQDGRARTGGGVGRANRNRKDLSRTAVCHGDLGASYDVAVVKLNTFARSWPLHRLTT